MVAPGPAAPDRPGAGGARKLSPGPAPAPPALSPKDTRDSAQYRASNHEQDLISFIKTIQVSEI